MKDARFTELVNLYIDRQISPDEAAELEAEIGANSRRRQMYRQYCQMHRATKLVYESFRANADAANAPAKQPGSIAYLESRRQRQKFQRWSLYAGGLAAAACLTVVVARIGFTAPDEVPVNILAAQPVEAEIQPADLASTPVEKPQYAARPVRAGLVSLRHGIVNETDYAAAMATLRQEEQRWIALTQQTGQPTAPQSLFDDGVFTTSERVVPAQNGRAGNSRQRGERLPVEFTAFQFQR